jgi:protease IV
MGDIAASGGYYIASACDYIVANYGTLTGSIGVIAMSPNLRGLFEKLGINMTVIKSGKYKDILSTFREITPEERQLIQEIIDSSYKKFVRDVARGRAHVQSEDQIRPIADGRIMSGETALKNKLIDKLGTFEDAIDEARKIAKLSEDCPVYDEVRSPIEQLLTRMEGVFGGASMLYQRPDSLRYENYYMIEYRYRP